MSDHISADRIEKALDKLAGFMVRLGARGPTLLPIYERLEKELEARREVDGKMAAVRARLKQSKGRKAAASSKSPPAAA